MLKLIKVLFLPLLIVIQFIGINNCKAAIETHENFTDRGIDIRTIQGIKHFTIADDKLTYPNFDWSIVHTHSIKNAVSVRIVDQQLVNYKIRLQITLSIIRYTDHTLGTTLPAQTVILNVDYDPAAGKTYQAIDTYYYSGAYKTEVSVTSVINRDTPVDTNIPFILQVEGSVSIDRTYDIPPDINLNIKANKFDGTVINTPNSQLSKQLKLSWDFTPGQEEYDIEWTTADDSGDNAQLINAMLTAGGGTSLSTNDLDLLFHNNSTRVTVSTAQDYIISLMYNNKYILVRMRYVHYTQDGIRINGDWNYTYEPVQGSQDYNYCIWTLDWNEPGLNWQYSAAFAEDGKKKEVISYFDGSLRGRQTVTLANNLSADVAIAQENIYDEFGRPIVSVLPTPYYESANTPSNLHFIPGLNLAQSTTNPYSVKNISSSATAVECEKQPDGMDAGSGASKYYSPNNELLTYAINDQQNRYKKFNFFIPNANLYPFSVKQYTNDNTGRVRLQGGVGDAFQPQAAGSKTTKYYYGKPEQWELDQMFGNDVGYADHYLKNMVIDPNGQASISYINASGKTIATALSGDLAPTSSLDQLSNIGQNVHNTTELLLKPDQFKFSSSDLTIKANTTYLSSNPGAVATFNYNIAQIIDAYPATGPNVSSSCYYNLTINITDDCGNAVLPTPITSPSPFTLDNAVSSSIPNVTLANVGAYYISFELSLSKKSIDAAADNYIDQAVNHINILQKKYDYIKQNFLQSIDLSGNYNDCRTCDALLGTETDFTAMVTQRFTNASVTPGADFAAWVHGLYTGLKTKCDNLKQNCDFKPCDSFKTLMEQDISPGGQYALFYEDGTPIEPAINVLATYFSQVFGTTATHVSPMPNEFYINKPDGSIMSVYDAGFDLKTMVKYWNPLWAARFLPYHPEYCKLKFCNDMSSYENWDELYKEVYTSAAGLTTAAGVTYSSTDVSWLLNNDPFFSGPGSGLKADMFTDLNTYSTSVLNNTNTGFAPLSLNKYVDYVIYRKGQETSTTLQDGTVWSNTTYPASNDICRVKDREWAMYKTLYFQLKQKYYDIFRTNSSLYCGSVPCDVGQPMTTPFPGSCPTPQAFAVIANTAANIAAAPTGRQNVLLTYTGPKFDGAITVQLYYPTSVTDPQSAHYNATLTTTTTALTYAGFPYAFNIPATLPPSTVHASNVVCEVHHISTFKTTVNVSDDLISDNKIDFSHWFDWSGYYYWSGQQTRRRTSITLLNSQIASVPVVVNVKYNMQYIGISGNPNIPDPYQPPPVITQQIVIPIGQSSAYFDYYSANPDVDGWWSHFQNISSVDSYTGANALTGYGVSNPPVPPPPISIPNSPSCPIAYQYKDSRFPTVEQYNQAITSGQSNQVQANNSVELQKQVNDFCTSNATAWMTALNQGLTAAGVTDMDGFKNQLIAVCTAGGDETHPFGASDLAGKTGASGSFGDVIKTITGNTYTPLLNPWLIASPYPYSSPQRGTSTSISNTDASLCTKITNYYGDYTNQLNGVTASDDGFHTYLVTRFGKAANISTDDLADLRRSCSCNYLLNADIGLPAFLDDHAQLSWADYQTALGIMQAQFASTSALTSSDQYPTILTNYMNQRYGFIFNYTDYHNFELANHSTTPVLYYIPPYNNVPTDIYAPVKAILQSALGNGVRAYDQYISDARNAFLVHYIATCAQVQTTVNINITTRNYHYTLYYYDQADNLVRTIPPDGVELIKDAALLQQVQNIRTSGGLVNCTHSANEPQTESSVPAAMGALSSALATTPQNSSTGQAIEMWLYNPNISTPNQVIKETTDGHYMFHTCISGGQLTVEMYKTTDNGGSMSFDLSNRVVGNISGITLTPWTHIVVQGTDFLHSAPDLYLNGVHLSLINNPPACACSWNVSTNGTLVTYPTNMTTLKHLRTYTDQLSGIEIQAHASSQCFEVIGTHATTALGTNWYRFNVPLTPGGPTAIASNSTLETTVNGVYPNHRLATTYQYNSTEQVVKLNTPDAGTSTFWYDMLSRLTASQNAQQAHDSKYSYTTYDVLGRVTEVGQKFGVTAPLDAAVLYLDDGQVSTFTGDGTNEQITHTYYDDHAELLPDAVPGLTAFAEQDNLRKRVTASTYREHSTDNVQQATYYNYDLDGNVKTLWQQINGLGIKRIDYEYDLISGKVNFMRYQDLPNQKDKFYYKYDYDAENRLVDTWSGTQAAVDPFGGSHLIPDNKRLDAHYEYYLHGPLARIELGDDIFGKVQGMDYAYTLQGWLKGVNSTNLLPGSDVGGDGDTNTAHSTKNSTIAADAFGYALHYYGDNDYGPIGIGTVGNAFANAGAAPGFKPLYNGNVAASSVNIPKAGNPMLYVYGYDQLNRLTRQEAYNGLAANNVWTPVTINNHDYRETVSYTANGNITDYTRNGNTTGGSNAMDLLHYKYNRDSQGNLTNNKLRYVNDDVPGSNYGGADLQSQNGSESQAAILDNYQYDAIGNLTKDVQAGISDIKWTAYGKIGQITKAGGTLNYSYDAAGQRVSKTTNSLTTYYVRDAHGNTLALYDTPTPGNNITWREQQLYGSNRLGLWTPNVNTATNSPDNADINWQNLGDKFYELNNHLGNVSATITNRKVTHYNNSVFDYFEADVATAQDYYPFGMLQPGRQFKANNVAYRYGFNGKENDNEVKGEGNQQNYGMRIYDPRVGRFLSMDPITQKYPELTPYQFASNRPINSIDIDGLEGWEEVLAGYSIYQIMFATAATATSAIVLHHVATHPMHLENPFAIPFRGMPTSTTSVRPHITPAPSTTIKPDIKPNPDNKPKPTPISPIVKNDEEKPDIVYRGGNNTLNNFTPAPKDLRRGPGGEDDYGLSTFRTPEQATQGNGGKAQKIDLNKIREMGFFVFPRDDGHVAIRPMTEEEFKAWVATKGTEEVHYRSVMVKEARIGEVNLPKGKR
jgi:RHS repeat-associated protein